MKTIVEDTTGRVFAKTTYGTKVEIIGKHVDINGEIDMYNVKKIGQNYICQVIPKDLIIEV